MAVALLTAELVGMDVALLATIGNIERAMCKQKSHVLINLKNVNYKKVVAQFLALL